MTNKEASEWFEKRAQEAPMPGAREAFKLAAEALEKNDSADEDSISRKEVIDYCNALMDAERKQQTDKWGYGRERYNQTEAIKEHVETMRPVQPKCIHCKDCARYDGKGHCERDVRDVLGYGREWNEDDYCSDGIRRETDG